MKYNDEQIEQAKQLILNQVTTNEDFRTALLTDPKKTSEEFLGIDLPDFDLKVIEESDATDDDRNDPKIVILPDTKTDLDLDDLDQVAGGGDCNGCYGSHSTGK